MHHNGLSTPVTKPPAAAAAPPAWPRTTRPLRIAFLGWAKLSAQWREGSGYNLSASELAAGLAMSGHSVSYLRSGMDYSIRPGMRIKAQETWRGIECFRLINSPNLAPAVFNFTNMKREIASPEQCRVVVGWLDSVGAQLVHIHSLEGFPMDVVAAIRASGRPVVVTPHNYHYVCPQVDLLRRENGVCMDYEGGKACVGCLRPADPWKMRLRRRLEQSVAATLGPGWANILRNEILEPANAARRAAHAKQAEAEANAQSAKREAAENAKRAADVAAGKQPPVPDAAAFKPRAGRRAKELAATPPDPEIAMGINVAPDPDHAGLIEHNLTLDPGEEWPTPASCAPDQNERFLSKTHHLKVLNEYGTRRAAGAGALAAASLVTPPSLFMGRVYESMGVPADRIRRVRLGQPHFDQINRRAKRSPLYDVRPWSPAESRPLRIGFFGTTRGNKGIAVLTSAIPLLSDEVRRRCQFVIRAAGETWPLRKVLSKYPEVSFQGPYDPLSLIAAGADYDIGVLPFVWFENSPLVLLEHLHAGKFVIASRLGGPPEWVNEPGERGPGTPGNGLMFAGGRPDLLARCLERLVSGEVVIPSPREIHEVSELWSYPAHVAEVETVYAGLVDGASARAAAPVAEVKPTGHTTAVV